MRKCSAIVTGVRKLLGLGANIALLLTVVLQARASDVSGDTIFINTIRGLPASNGVTFSSYSQIISGSSLTLQGAGGYITTSSSITAASFWGDGANLAGLSFLTATQAFSGANTFTSSFTVQNGGREIVLSTDPITSNIRISSQGVLSFYPELHNSSSTLIPPYTTTNTSFGPCVSGSTLTISTSGGMVEATIQTNVSISSDGICGSWWAGINFLQDGQYVRNLTLNEGPGYVSPPGSCDSAGKSIRINYLLDPPSTGPHSYCLTVSAPGGVHATSIGYSAGSIFYIKELK